MTRVKRRRPYDSSGRLEQARLSREAVLSAAEREFLARGYARTTVARLAQKAKVSVETIYKAFGGKPGLVRALVERGLAGRGPVPAPQRSDAMSAEESDPRRLVGRWGTLTAEVSPLVAPLLLLVREAAASDPELRVVLRDIDQKRLTRMQHNAQVLAARGFLRAGVTPDEAGDLMWTLTAPELYDLLVVRRGWTPEKLGELVTTTLVATLLPR